MGGFRSVPTALLREMWESGVRSMEGRDPSEMSPVDYGSLYEMRRELDRRRDEPKRIVDVNFSKDYLTD